MKRYTRFGLSALLAVAMSGVFAGEKTGLVSSIIINNSYPNKAFIKLDKPYSLAEPVCSQTVDTWDFVFDHSTATGKALYAMALAAQLAEKEVKAFGYNTCALFGGYEDLRYLATEP